MLGIHLPPACEDPMKFEKLYHTYRVLMLHIAMGVLQDQAEAEDAVQEAFLRVLKIMDRVGEIHCGKTKGLLVIITRHIALDMVKSKWRASRAELDEWEADWEDDAPLPLEQVVRTEGYEKLLGCIARLSATYRTVCQLRFVYEFDEKSISRLLGLTPKAVNMRIVRGRQMLKKMILKEMEQDESNK